MGSAHEVKPEHEEKPELPTVDVAKDAMFEHGKNAILHSENAAMLEWLGLAPEEMGKEGVATTNENLESFGETFEGIGTGFNVLGTAQGIDDLTGRDKTVEQRIKGGVTAASGITGLIGGSVAEASPALGAGVRAYDMTKAGSQGLKETGVFGQNEDKSNRDAAQWAAHVGHEAHDVGGALGASISIGPDGKLAVGSSDNIMGDIAGGLGVLGGSMVSGAMSFGAGAAMVGEDLAKPLSLDNMQEMAVQLKQKEAAEEKAKAQKEAAYQAKIANLKGDDLEKAKKDHAIQQALSFWTE